MTNATSADAPRSRLIGRSWRRAAAWSCLVLVALILVPAAMMVGPVLRDPTAGFTARKGRLTGVEVRSVTRQGSSTVNELRLASDSGLAVDLTVRVPDGPEGRIPTVLILGGRGTGQDAARLGSDIGDVVVAALSYPFAGDPTVRGVRAVPQLLRIQRAVLDTVPAILLATDYLLEQPYIDADRFELIGVSLGAFLVSPAGVLDKRIRRVWIVHGAGNPTGVIDYGLQDRVGIRPLRRVIATLLNLVVAGHYLAPERWVGRISPRPVIAINARDDGHLPRACVDALHAALRDPYEIVWVDGPHVLPNRNEVIENLGAQILKRVSDARDETLLP
jgi:dienelactone hydrolase